MPVSTSTATSAICTPPTPLSERFPGPGLAPVAVMGERPNSDIACFQVIARSGAPLTRTFPSAASSSSGLAFSSGAAFANT